MSASIKVSRTKLVNGFYPLNLVVARNIGGEPYDNKNYQIVHNDKGYKALPDYPLDNLDF